MNCCKSNDAVQTQTQPPKVAPRELESPKEQAPSSEQASSPDKSYGNFLEPKNDDVFDKSQTQDSSVLKMNASTIDAEVSKSVEGYLMNNDTSQDVDDMLKDLPNIQTASVDFSPTPALKLASSDDITTVYEEPPRVPKGSYAYLPQVPQRGYEPWGSVSYAPKDEWQKTKPYRIGTIVWYRNTTDPGDKFRKFKWYIPGVVEEYVWNEKDKNEVVGYKIKIDERSVKRIDEYFLDKLNNAEPENVMLRWNNETPPCPVEGINDNASKVDSDTRMHELLEEYGEDLGFQGAKQNGLGPHLWGITLQQLMDVRKDPMYDESMSMYDVVDTIIKPKTEGTGMGYALLLNKENPIRAKYMISHAWGENYSQFISALHASHCDGPLWVCAMAICQNNDIEEVTIERQLGPDPQFGPFATVLKQADSMIAIMTQSCDIYTRLWCVYEIFIAISLNIPVRLQSYNEITGYGGSDKMYSNVVLDSSGTSIETIKASCGYEEDKAMIEEEIMKLPGGFDLIDDVVMWVRIKALIDDMKNCDKRMWTESQLPVPIGTCSASNISSRQNAGIANAIKVWQDAKKARTSGGEDIGGFNDNDDSSSSLGYFSNLLRDKLCGGSSFF